MIQVVLYEVHPHDPLGGLIEAFTRSGYEHAAMLKDRTSIIEAYYPHVRERALIPGELNGADIFDIQGLTPEVEKAVLDWCAVRIAANESYSIANLFRYLAPARSLIGEAKDDGSAKVPTICSQFVYNALKNGGGLPIFSNEVNAYAVDPGHLAWSPSLIKTTKP